MQKLIIINIIIIFSTGIVFNNSYPEETKSSCPAEKLDIAQRVCRKCWSMSEKNTYKSCSSCYHYLFKHIKDCSSCAIEQYLANGMPPDLITPDSETILILLAKQGNESCLRVLLKKNVNVNAVDSFGFSALMLCAKEGFNRCAELLIEAGADLDMQTKKGSTAVMFAASYGHEYILKALVENNATIDIQAKTGYTAMSYAAINGRWECVSILFSSGSNCCTVFNINLLARSNYTYIPTCCLNYIYLNVNDIIAIGFFFGIGSLYLTQYFLQRHLAN